MTDSEIKKKIVQLFLELHKTCKPDPTRYRAFAVKANYLIRTTHEDHPAHPSKPLGLQDLLTDETYMRS